MTSNSDAFRQTLLLVLDETFETHHGIYLDTGTSLLTTLDGITAEQASQPVGGQCATLAAQVAHVTFYLDVLERYMLRQEVGTVDWGEIWRTVGAVTPEAWLDLRQQLAEAYRRIDARLRALESWDDENLIGGALAITVHTAYHLGEIRQALCTLR
ncbi:MAG: hypothetical protein R2844_04945 [Caldilineales bacterium]